MMQQIQRNYDQIKADAQAIINEEMDRIKNDPELCKRLGLDNEKHPRRSNSSSHLNINEVRGGIFPSIPPPILLGRSSAIGVFLSSTSRTPRQSPSLPHVLFAHSAPVQESHD